MGQHGVYQTCNVFTERHQGAQVRCGADGASQMNQVHPLQGEQVSLRDHADQAMLLIHHADMSKMVLGHEHGGFKGIGVTGKANWAGRHYLAERNIQGRVLFGHQGAQVP